MRSVACILAWAVLAAATATAADEAVEAAARKAYEAAFAEDLEPEERVEMLEAVATDYEDAVVVDDALWVLGEWAARDGRRADATAYRQRLLDALGEPTLEKFTVQTDVYRTSQAAQARRLFRMVGGAYRIGKNNKLTRRNTVPMTAHEQVARFLETQNDLDGALAHFESARTEAPEGSVNRRIYDHCIARVREAIVAREAHRRAMAELARKEPDDTTEPGDEETELIEFVVDDDAPDEGETVDPDDEETDEGDDEAGNETTGEDEEAP